MNEKEYDLMRRVEDSHWWYAVLHESVEAELSWRLSGKAEAHILDAGCGTGGMMEVLRRGHPSWKLTGLDASAQAIEHSRARGFVDLVMGSVDSLPFPDASFDAVLSLDVLYFEGVDEAKAMAEFCRVLKPGGVLILNLPAFDILRGEHDVAVRGVRRYTPNRVHKMLEKSTLVPMHVHCWNLWLFLPILCWRWLSRVRQPVDSARAKSDLSMPPAFLNAGLLTMARLDMAVCRAIRSPWGTSVRAVATKKLT